MPAQQGLSFPTAIRPSMGLITSDITAPLWVRPLAKRERGSTWCYPAGLREEGLTL